MKKLFAALVVVTSLAFASVASAASCGWSTDGAWHYSPAYSAYPWSVSYAYYGHQWDGYHNNRLFLVYRYNIPRSYLSYYSWELVYCG